MDPNSVDVLLIEDSPEDAELTIRELKKNLLANNLVHVRDGEAALDFLFSTGRYKSKGNSSGLPKVILLDIHLPKLNGMEVLKRIREDERTKRIPVVMLTSSDQDPDIYNCYDLGANSYIVKPLSFERFAEAIRSFGFYWLLLNQPPT